MSRQGKTPRIVLYTAPGCPNCRQMQQWLTQRRIRYRTEDVTRSARALKELQRLGARGVPVLQVGKRVIHGFQPARLERLLREAGLPLAPGRNDARCKNRRKRSLAPSPSGRGPG